MDPLVVRLVVVVAVVAVATALGRWWSSRDGRIRTDHGHARLDPRELESVGLNGDGAPVQALLLGSPTCAPCEQVKRILGEVERERPHFRWVEVDAGDHLDLARAHHVMRVPTLFVVDVDGVILARTSGVPAVHDLVRILDRAA